MTPTEIEQIFRDEAGRALATLIRLVGDFDLAEDALQEAFAAALESWPAAAPPSGTSIRKTACCTSRQASLLDTTLWTSSLESCA